MSAKRTILICEDDPVQLRILTTLFERDGYATLTASSPADAALRIRDIEPDLVLTDVQLRQGNGFDLVDSLRKSGIEVPVVMISGSATESTRERAKAMGVINLIEKPLAFIDVVRRVGEIIRLDRARSIDGRILIVDDDAVARKVLSESLFQAGADVLIAEDGAAAIRMLGSADPPVDLALADLHLPGIAGPGLIESLRKTSPGLFVAVVTGEAVQDEIRAAFGAGATALIRKPFSTKEVIAFIDRNLEGARRMREEAKEKEQAKKAPRLERFRAWLKSYASARKGSRKHRQRTTAAIVSVSVIAGIVLAAILAGLLRSMEHYKKESERLIEALERHRGPNWRDFERGLPDDRGRTPRPDPEAPPRRPP